MIRDKKSMNAGVRLQRLLHSAVFNLVRDDPRLLAKVQLVRGDLKLPGLGLNETDAELLRREVSGAGARRSHRLRCALLRRLRAVDRR